MFGMDYIAASTYNIMVVIVSMVVLAVGSFTDFQKREVADWINYGLFFAAIGLRLIYSAITLDPFVILEGFIGFIAFTVFGFGMFYLGQWGGGDTKMIIGLGTLFGLKVIPFDLYAVGNSLLVSFLVNSLLVGSLYGLLWSVVLVFKNRKKFLKNWKIVSKRFQAFKILFALLGAVLIFAGFFLEDMGIFLVPLGMLAIVMIYSFIFTRSIEKGCMIAMLPPSKITEGDWIEKDVKVKGKYICGPRDLGISKKQIALLKKYKVKKVAVKNGIPFVPSFLLGFIATFFFGNFIVFLLQVLMSNI